MSIHPERSYTVKVRKGMRITIPKALREKYGFTPGTVVEFEILDVELGQVLLRKVEKR